MLTHPEHCVALSQSKRQPLALCMAIRQRRSLRKRNCNILMQIFIIHTLKRKKALTHIHTRRDRDTWTTNNNNNNNYKAKAETAVATTRQKPNWHIQRAIAIKSAGI